MRITLQSVTLRRTSYSGTTTDAPLPIPKMGPFDHFEAFYASPHAVFTNSRTFM